MNALRFRDKDAPTPAEIDRIRSEFVIDPETDGILVSKMNNRAGPGYEPLALDAVAAALRALLDANGFPGSEVADLSWLSGGASKLQFVFRLLTRSDREGRLWVLRMEPPASIVETSRRLEFEVLAALRGVVPVPEPLCLDRDGRYLPYPGLIYAFVDGVTKPSGASSNVSGFGVSFDQDQRSALGEQFASHLARIHSAGPGTKQKVPAFGVPESNREAASWQLRKWTRVWFEDANLDIPLLSYARRWLEDHLPDPDVLSIVHGDYRVGNFLFDEQSNEITAWLDWELAHLGDRHEDIAHILLGANMKFAEDGITPLVGGLVPTEHFTAIYERESGLKINWDAVFYYKVFNSYRAVITLLATGYRSARLGKTHQDIVLCWIMGLGYAILGELEVMLREVEDGSQH
jgi:aminoglycoside phosphotransferase (APT) family kinase protein